MAAGGDVHTVRGMATTVLPPAEPRRRPTIALAGGAGLRQLGVFAVAYLIYFGVRAITEGSTGQAVANAWSLIGLERDLGIAWEGALQEAILGSRVLVDAANAVYMYGHWPVLILTGVLLFRYRRQHYFRLRDACLLSGLIGLVIFSLFPVAPPRLTDLPIVDTVTRDDAGYRQIVPPSLVNEYAAMPSFHAGWNLLVGVVVAGATRHRLLRTLSALVPASMVIAVVVTANHYILDVVAGVTIALICLFARDRLVRRRRLDRGERRRHSEEPRRRRYGAVPHRAPRRQRSHAAAAGRDTRTAPD